MVFEGLYTVTGTAITIAIGLGVNQVSDRFEKFPRVLGLVLTGFIVSELAFTLPLFEPFIHPLEELEFIEFMAELALSLVLFREGLELDLRSFIDNLRNVIILATIGVLLTVVIFAVTVSLVTPISFLLALLIAGILAPTDPAATFSMFKGSLRINAKERQIIGNESALNDAVAIVLVTTVFIESVKDSAFNLSFAVVVDLITSFFGAIILGYLLAYLFLRFHQQVDNQVTANLLTLSLAILSFAFSLYLSQLGIKTSAAIASLSAGIVFGNPPLFGFREFPQRELYEFNENVAEFGQIAAFIAIGSLMTFQDMGPSLLYGAFFGVIVLAARFASVAGVLTQLTDIDQEEGYFISWAGMRGLATGVLATITVLDLGGSLSVLGISSSVFLNSILVALILTTLVQSATMKELGVRTNSVSIIDYSVKLQIERKIVISKMDFLGNLRREGTITVEEYRARSIPLRDELEKIDDKLNLERQTLENRVASYLQELRMMKEVGEQVEDFIKQRFSSQDIEDVPGYEDFLEITEDEAALADKLMTELERIRIRTRSPTVLQKEKENLVDLTKDTKNRLASFVEDYDLEKSDKLIELCEEIIDEWIEEVGDGEESGQDKTIWEEE